MTIVEFIAVVFSISYVILAAKESIWCWLCAAISASLYIYICYTAKLKAEVGLQVFYLIMAYYGYWQWKKPKTETTIIKWSTQSHCMIIILGLLFSFLLGNILNTYSIAALPNIDSFTTVFSLFATYMATKKILENWLYWIVIDVVSIYLYFSRDLQLTAGLFLVYVVIAFFGYFQWKKRIQPEV